VARSQGPQTKGWITSGENRERLANPGRVVAQGLVRFLRVEI
jgi:hypothetical protein